MFYLFEGYSSAKHFKGQNVSSFHKNHQIIPHILSIGRNKNKNLLFKVVHIKQALQTLDV